MLEARTWDSLPTALGTKYGPGAEAAGPLHAARSARLID